MDIQLSNLPTAIAPVTVKPAKEVRFGITRPDSGTLGGSVWDIADGISSYLGAQSNPNPVALIGEVKKLYTEAHPGAALSTCSTQYTRWVKYYGVATHVAARRAAEVTSGKSETELKAIADKAQAKLDAANKFQERQAAAAKKVQDRIDAANARMEKGAEKTKTRLAKALAAQADAKAKADAAIANAAQASGQPVPSASPPVATAPAPDAAQAPISAAPVEAAPAPPPSSPVPQAEPVATQA